MKNTTVVTDFKDLRKAIEEITKNQPAETRYQQQAKKMGYTKDKTVVVEQSISEASAFDDMKDIVKTKGAKKIGGVMVDMFTASVITKAYDKVNDANKKKMEKANVQTLVKLAHKVMGLNASFEFDKTPLKGFPFNEVVEDTEIQEWISKNGDRRRVSERDKRKLKEHGLDEGKMSDLLIDIQQGATAKEIAKDFKIPLSVAKGFLQDYYGQKKGSRKESISHDCATHVEHATWGLGTVVSGEHDLVEQEDGSHKVEHYTVEFSHGVEKMISIYELNVTEKMVHSHKMSKDAGRKKLKSSVKKEGQFWGQKKMSKAHKDKLKKDGAVMLQKKEKGGMSRITLAKGHKDIKKYMKQGYKQIQIESVNEAKLETIVLSYDLIKLIGGMSVMKKIMKKKFR